MMEVRLLAVLCLFALAATGSSAKAKAKNEDLEETYGDLLDSEADTDGIQNDDIDDYGGEDVQDVADVEKAEDIHAEINTKPQVFNKAIGETVLLPCNVTNAAEVVTIWQRGSTYLYQGSIKMGNVENIQLHPNNSLEVVLRHDKDFDEYTCKIVISAEDNPQIVHKVIKLMPPRIISLSTADNKTVYHAGDSFTVVCLAEGNPTPEISWFKAAEGERLGIKGTRLTIENANFASSGIYRCLADNKMKPAAHQHIQINVEHKPILQIEKFLVNSDKESDAELKCKVRSYPPAKVMWRRNGQAIPNKPPKVVLKKNSDNIENLLTITNLKEEDFGEYSCVAENDLARVEKKVNLVKTPAVQDFLKPEKSTKDVVLTWKVESKAPISRHQLQYRKKGEEQWQTIEPEVLNGEQDVYTVKYEIKNLDGGNYETRLRSENVHGWSEYSPVMTFESVLAKHGANHRNHNKKHHHKEKDIKEKNLTPSPDGTPAQHQENETKETSVGASKSGGSITTSSAFLVGITLLPFLFRNQ